MREAKNKSSRAESSRATVPTPKGSAVSVRGAWLVRTRRLRVWRALLWCDHPLFFREADSAVESRGLETKPRLASSDRWRRRERIPRLTSLLTAGRTQETHFRVQDCTSFAPVPFCGAERKECSTGMSHDCENHAVPDVGSQFDLRTRFRETSRRLRTRMFP